MGPKVAPSEVTASSRIDEKPYRRWTPNMAVSITTPSGPASGTTASPAIRHSPPASSRSDVAHATNTGAGTPSAWRMTAKCSGPRPSFANPWAAKPNPTMRRTGRMAHRPACSEGITSCPRARASPSTRGARAPRGMTRGLVHSVPLFASLPEPRLEVVAHPEGVGDDGQRRIHRRAGGKEAPVDHVEIVDLVGPAIDVQRGGSRVAPEADGSVLVRNTGEGDALTEKQVPRE